MSASTATTCPYCGVGCGIIATTHDDGSIGIAGDKLHPANLGRLCSKGAALGETLGLDDRLLYPEVDGRRVEWDAAINTVAERFKAVIAEHGPDAVAFYVSGQLLTEDYYVANKLMKGFIGSANIDTNSRLCMASSVAGHKRAFGADTVPCDYTDLEQARLIVLTGSNIAWCHPVLYQRISQAKRSNPECRVVVIDPRRTVTCDGADLHLPLRPGADAVLFNGLLAYLDANGFRNELYVERCTEGADTVVEAAHASAGTVVDVAHRCGLDAQALETFYHWFADTERVVTVYSQGINQTSSGTDKVNAIINCHLLTGRIGRPGMGPFSFTGQPNAMGGREVGGLANQLAAHMELDNEVHRDRVQRFWRSPRIAQRAGLTAVNLFQAVKDKQVRAVWVMATNPVVSLPDADTVRAALAHCEFVVVSDCVHHTDTTALAQVLLPALAWGEKDGTVTNSERRISRQRRFLPAPGEARPDWWIINRVAQAMGFAHGFDHDNAAQIFREHATLSAFENDGARDFDLGGLVDLSDAAFDDLAPVQWPMKQHADGKRLFADGRFFTASGKARFIAVTPAPVAYAPDESFPLRLNTGRIRDQWHTMTRTGKTARLMEHSPEPYIELHPADAAIKGIEDGALVRVFSRWGEAIVRARVSVEQQPGSVFVPMHWNAQFARLARINAAVNPALDPISGQPEYKHTPVNVARYEPQWHGFLLSRRQLALTDAGYWVKAIGAQHYRYELAGDQLPKDWPAWARGLLCQSDTDIHWVEYLDVAARSYRGVRLVGGRIESCVYIGPSHKLPPRSWLAGLFAKEKLSAEERAALLAGRAPAGQQDSGRIVCACFHVGLNTIVEAIAREKLDSVEAIGACLKAGTNCRSCVPELTAILAQSAAKPA